MHSGAVNWFIIVVVFILSYARVVVITIAFQLGLKTYFASQHNNNNSKNIKSGCEFVNDDGLSGCEALIFVTNNSSTL